MTGIGGDVFAIVYDGERATLKALNSSGRAGARARRRRCLRAAGSPRCRRTGRTRVTVPGAVAGWASCSTRTARFRWRAPLAPAIRYARDGSRVAEIVADHWETQRREARAGPGGRERSCCRADARRARARSSAIPSSRHASSRSPRTARDAIYGGAIGEAIAADIARRGGLPHRGRLRRAHVRLGRSDPHDLSRLRRSTRCRRTHRGSSRSRCSTSSRATTSRAMGHNSAEYLHVLAEAKRIAFADRGAYLADPAHVPATCCRRSSRRSTRRRGGSEHRSCRRPRPQHAAPALVVRAAAIAATRCTSPPPTARATRSRSSTRSSTCSARASSSPGTGIVLHSRGSGFTPRAGPSESPGAGKRPLHTLVPAFLMKDGKPLMAFGVMGGDNQAQAHAQIVVNVVDFGMNVQEAGDAARVRHSGAGLAVESGDRRRRSRAELRRRGTRS